jgi:hypothetical protein
MISEIKIFLDSIDKKNNGYIIKSWADSKYSNLKKSEVFFKLIKLNFMKETSCLVIIGIQTNYYYSS